MNGYRQGMARLARVVVPGVPHHVTQRGNRRQATFFHEADYIAYLDLMAEWWHSRMGVLPHAQPCAPDRRTGDRGWIATPVRPPRTASLPERFIRGVRHKRIAG